MGLLNGTCSVSRWTIAEVPDFAAAAFQEIPPGSEIRRAIGFVPMKPGEPWGIGARRWAGRVRIDEIRPDPQTVTDRLEELVQAELDAGSPPIGPKRRRKLRELAIEEASIGVAPRRKCIEWAIDGDTLLIGSASRAELGEVLGLFRKVSAAAPTPIVPWSSLPDMASSVLPAGESAWGPRFLRELFGERSQGLFFEPEAGRVAMVAAETKVTVTGEIHADVAHHLEQGAEITSAKLLHPKGGVTLDATTWWLKGLSVETEAHEHWTDQLDERLEKIVAVFDLLDAAFRELRPAIERESSGDGRVAIQEGIPGADGDQLRPGVESVTLSYGGNSVTLGPDFGKKADEASRALERMDEGTAN